MNTHFTDEEAEADGINALVEAVQQSLDQSLHLHMLQICPFSSVGAQPSSFVLLTSVCVLQLQLSTQR